MGVRILSAGITELDPEKFNTNPDGKDFFLNKPFGYLYGSTMFMVNGNISSNWIEWVEAEQFHPEKYKDAISFKLQKKSKIFTVDSIWDYADLLKRYGKVKQLAEDRYNLYIDFPKLAQDYDAFHLTLDAFYKLRMFRFYFRKVDFQIQKIFLRIARLHCRDAETKNRINQISLRVEDFYSYDCETWIIFNLDCINKGSILNHRLKIIKNLIDLLHSSINNIGIW